MHYFTDETFLFLRKLSRNNHREWFEQHKQDYEDVVRTPALRFIADMQGDLAQLSQHFLAIPKKVGGSLMRVHRDVRFGRDKRPYKTNIGIQFRHEAGKDVHAPGFYLHIEPGECFLGGGVWRPDAPALGKIREAIVEKPDQWKKASDSGAFAKQFALGGESLSRPPRGYLKDHPYIEDLKRKDFIALCAIPDDLITSATLRKQVMRQFALAGPYVEFLCRALALRY